MILIEILILITMGILLVISLLQLALARRFAPLSPNTKKLSEFPLVSVIVAAKDEGDCIAQCVSSLTSLSYENLEVIVVDDRSTDQTPQVLARIRNPRLKTLRIDQLPSGWLGKCHALQKGAEAASGEYLLFTDGDVKFADATLEAAVATVTEQGLDHLALLPKLETEGWWECLITYVSYYLGSGFLLPKAVANPNIKKLYMGVGAFNLVKRTMWERFDGHKALRLEILDDVMLARLVKKHGGRMALRNGADWIRVRWQRGVWGWITGVEKNSFAALHFSWVWVEISLLGLLMTYVGPIIGVLALEGALFYMSLALIVSENLSLALFFRRNKLSATYTFGLVPAIGIFCFAVLRSAILCHRQDGVRWRDTHYSLKDLKDYRREQF